MNAFANLQGNNLLQNGAWQIGNRVDRPIQQPASPGVVSFESRSGSQQNALIHRGQLKK